jgi:CheY-like chemotaxis protein
MAKKTRGAAPANARVLVIHRDPDMRRQIKEGLVATGWEIYQAEGRVDGLPLMYQVQPDLIFLEVGPDGGESWETFFSIRLFTDRPAILLASQLPLPAYRSDCKYNALVLLEPVSVEAACAVAHALHSTMPALEPDSNGHDEN